MKITYVPIKTAKKNVFKKEEVKESVNYDNFIDELRAIDTNQDDVIKEILEKLNISYKFQEWIEQYRVDFLIPSCKLVVKSDGRWSHGDPRFCELPTPKGRWLLASLSYLLVRPPQSPIPELRYL